MHLRNEQKRLDLRKLDAQSKPGKRHFFYGPSQRRNS